MGKSTVVGRGPGRPKEFETRFPVFLTKAQDDAVRAVMEQYETSYSEALRFLINCGISARTARPANGRTGKRKPRASSAGD